MSWRLAGHAMVGAVFGILAALAAIWPACAQDYPTRSVRIVVPFPAGGTADAMPRLVGDFLSRKWGHPVVVDNRPGAAGNNALPRASVGNASLAIVAGFPQQPGVPNPLAGHPYTLLRDSMANLAAKAGVVVPPGTSPFKTAGMACGNRTPDCQKITDAIKANAASAVRADANGNGTFSGIAPGTYYLMISTRYNNQGLVWSQPVQVKPGSNSLTLDQRNATPLN